MAATHVFYTLGARYATATTDADNTYLNTLYRKSAGILQGRYATDDVECEAALYLFDLTKLVKHKAIRRVVRSLEMDVERAQALRNRRLVQRDTQPACTA